MAHRTGQAPLGEHACEAGVAGGIGVQRLVAEVVDAGAVDLARTAPGTLTALGRVKGIGPAKLERYGAEILDAISSSTAPADGDGG